MSVILFFLIILVNILVVIAFYKAWFGNLDEKWQNSLDRLPKYMTWSLPKSLRGLKVYFRILTTVSLLGIFTIDITLIMKQ